MAWVVPRTWTTGEVVTAAMMNGIRDALNDLDRRTSPVVDEWLTYETTSSTAYTDLGGVARPAVTATVGSTGKAFISYYALLGTNTAGISAHMSYIFSGANSWTADHNRSINFTSPTAGGGGGMSVTHLAFGLFAGSTTATAKYCAGGAATAFFQYRRIMIQPLGA